MHIKTRSGSSPLRKHRNPEIYLWHKILTRAPFDTHKNTPAHVSEGVLFSVLGRSLPAAGTVRVVSVRDFDAVGIAIVV